MIPPMTPPQSENEAEFYLPEFKELIDDPQTHSRPEKRFMGPGASFGWPDKNDLDIWHIWVNFITTEACSPEAWNHG